jgi:hypothetical protein
VNILVHHDDDIAAVVSPKSARLCPPYDERPADDTDRQLILLKCAYALKIASGEIDDVYDDDEADRIARRALADEAARP